MASVYVSNIVVNSGADFDQTFTLEDPATSSLYDLTNYTVTSQVRKHSGSSTYTNFTVTLVEPQTSGKIIISLTPTQTSALKPGRYVYDILIESPGGLKTRVVEGMVLVREGVTR
jgi:hypothetical protein